MNHILVSIIVPIYNVEQYIEQCVASILSQDHSNIEVILVDDGSPDRSAEIIDDLAKRDSRIRVVHKENGGVSTARNAGLDIAKGEYVMFVDGDDYVDPDYVSYFLNLVIKNDCEIAMNMDFYTVKAPNAGATNPERMIDALKAIEYIYLGKLNEAVWNKIYKKSFLSENDIKFDPDYWYGEGMLFNINCLQYVDKISLGGKKVYHQVYNPDSAMRNFNLESNYCGLRSLDRQKELWKKKNKDVENAWEYHRWWFSSSILFGLVKSNMVNEYKDEYKKCLKNIRFNFRFFMKVNIGLKKKLAFLLVSTFPVLMARRGARRARKLAEQAKK